MVVKVEVKVAGGRAVVARAVAARARVDWDTVAVEGKEVEPVVVVEALKAMVVATGVVASAESAVAEKVEVVPVQEVEAAMDLEKAVEPQVAMPVELAAVICTRIHISNNLSNR